MERSIIGYIERLITPFFSGVLKIFSRRRSCWAQVFPVAEHVIIVRLARGSEHPVTGRANEVRCSRTQNAFSNNWSDTSIERKINGTKDIDPNDLWHFSFICDMTPMCLLYLLMSGQIDMAINKKNCFFFKLNLKITVNIFLCSNRGCSTVKPL